MVSLHKNFKETRCPPPQGCPSSWGLCQGWSVQLCYEVKNRLREVEGRIPALASSVRTATGAAGRTACCCFHSLTLFSAVGGEGNIEIQKYRVKVTAWYSKTQMSITNIKYPPKISLSMVIFFCYYREINLAFVAISSNQHLCFSPCKLAIQYGKGGTTGLTLCK